MTFVFWLGSSLCAFSFELLASLVSEHKHQRIWFYQTLPISFFFFSRNNISAGKYPRLPKVCLSTRGEEENQVAIIQCFRSLHRDMQASALQDDLIQSGRRGDSSWSWSSCDLEAPNPPFILTTSSSLPYHLPPTILLWVRQDTGYFLDFTEDKTEVQSCENDWHPCYLTL